MYDTEYIINLFEKGEIYMTLQQVLNEVLARAIDSKFNVYMQDAYKIQAKKLQKLIAIKGASCPVSNVSIEDVNQITLIDTYA